MMDFLNEVDLREESKDVKLFFQRLKGYMTGNVDGFPKKPEGLRKITQSQLGAAGFSKHKFQNLEDLRWDYKERVKNVVYDPEKRQLVRRFFEQDTVTVESTLPRERETVEVEGEPRLRRYYLDSIDNLVTRFLDETPEFKSSRSSVKEILKTFKYFHHGTEAERIHSACRTCRQLDLYVEAINLSDGFGEEFMTRDQLSRLSTCEGPISEVICIENLCLDCQGDEGCKKATERLKQMVIGSLNEEITWVVLAKDNNGRECEAQSFDSIESFINELSQYLTRGCESSGSGSKPVCHIHRLLNMQLERRNIFKELEGDKDLLVLEIDHGPWYKVKCASYGMESQLCHLL